MDDNSLLKRTLTSYDHSYESVTSLYDKLAYSRNIGICEYKPKVIISGNIIKFNHYKMGSTQVIQMPDEEFEIPDYRLHPEKYTDKKSDNNKSEDNSTETKTINASTKHLNQTGSTLPETPSSEPDPSEIYDDEENYVVPPLSELDDGY